jgi:IS5 family transposase
VWSQGLQPTCPEVECIGKGKPLKSYEFGVKVSVATTLKHCKGGRFAIHVQALPGKPYDGHTLARIIPEIEELVGNTIERLHTDAGYRGHNGSPEYAFKIYTSKQKRRVTPQIKREMRRRAAISFITASGGSPSNPRPCWGLLAFRPSSGGLCLLVAARLASPKSVSA